MTKVRRMTTIRKKNLLYLFAALIVVASASAGHAEVPATLRVGRAGHAFDHVGAISEQADVAAASGVTIIYASGLGALGYEGLPADAEFKRQRDAVAQYNRGAKERGIELSMGYLCATSIVGLESFDDEWSEDFRSSFRTLPSEWRQLDRQGNALASWYGGEYHPACMNHPDWRAYEQFMVRHTLDTGHDGIFFDNPTVHPDGCYCAHCMKKFAAFLQENSTTAPLVAGGQGDSTEAMRAIAVANPRSFLQFRSTIARDFLAEMRSFARTIAPEALITCNNSLNSPDRLYAQSRIYGYNIYEMSQAEDFVLVEDMVNQPRITPEGQTFEYGPTYKQLHAISHGKPIVAVTLAGGDYYTAPNLVRLAMAEAAAHGASYLSWPAWPEEQRERMAAAIRPQADLLREYERLLNEGQARDDVHLFLPFRRWVETDHCRASELAAELCRANIQFRVVSEGDFTIPRSSGRQPVFLLESRSVLTPDEASLVAQFEQAGGRVVAAGNADWLATVQESIDRPALTLSGPPTVRAVVCDQPNRTIVHLYNLNIQRLSSFEDRVTPATDVKLTVRVPMNAAGDAILRTADEQGTRGPLKFTARAEGGDALVDVHIPRIDVSAIIVITP